MAGDMPGALGLGGSATVLLTAAPFLYFSQDWRGGFVVRRLTSLLRLQCNDHQVHLHFVRTPKMLGGLVGEAL